MKKQRHIIAKILVAVTLLISLCLPAAVSALTLPTPNNPQSGSVGLQGDIPSPPPSVGPTIATPGNGQTFTTQPVTVSGICPSGLLIKLFINDIFSGSAECTNGSYSIVASLFDGTNVLVAVDYDALNQQGPNSNSVTVTFNNSSAPLGPAISLTSNYAKLGANPGQVLSWPIIISGGNSPYAISVDWGDGKSPDLISQLSPGTFTITHTYSESGVYNIIIKATDANGNDAYLQLVGVANGPVNQSSTSNSKSNNSKTKSGLSNTTLLIFSIIIIVIAISTFWLGSRHRVQVIKDKLEKGERPF